MGQIKALSLGKGDQMSTERSEPTLDLSEIRQEVGDALWLLVVYSDMAAQRWTASDEDLTCVLGTSTLTIMRWKIRLIETGLISVESAQDGETRIVINRDVLFRNSYSGAGSQQLAEIANTTKEWTSLSTPDREFLHQCGIKVEEMSHRRQ